VSCPYSGATVHAVDRKLECKRPARSFSTELFTIQRSLDEVSFILAGVRINME
jgi:hypothetical protein